MAYSGGSTPRPRHHAATSQGRTAPSECAVRPFQSFLDNLDFWISLFFSV